MGKQPHHRHAERKSDAPARRATASSNPTLQHGPARGSVRNLQELYTVAVGVALVKAMEVFVGPASEHVGAAAQHVRWTSWPALVALVATLVPFYHGAMRHLDKTYVEDRGVIVRRGALLADFLWLFIEAGILLGMALQLGELERFAWWLVFLLVFDSVWGLMVHLFLTSKPRGWTEFKWAIVNVPTALGLIVLLLVASRPGDAQVPALLWAGIPAIALVRSIVDYTWSWSFYFPMETSDQ